MIFARSESLLLIFSLPVHMEIAREKWLRDSMDLKVSIKSGWPISVGAHFSSFTEVDHVFH